jgi:hypothetical protein
MVAALVGALAGAAAPITRTEEEQVGKLGATALDAAKGKAQEFVDMARDKKDELVEKADQKMNEGQRGSGNDPSGQGNAQSARTPEFGSV